MTWIEDWLQVSPDGGNGTLELLLILIVAAGVATALVAWSPRARSVLRRMSSVRSVSRVEREPNRYSAD